MTKTFKFAIKAWLGGKVLFEAELDTKLEGSSEQVKLGEAVKAAYLQGAYLRGADLQGAYLQGADLQGADLQGADLQGADLQGHKIYIAPVILSGLQWWVMIYADRIQIGCKDLTVKEWLALPSSDTTKRVDEISAAHWKAILTMAKTHTKQHEKAKKVFEAEEAKKKAA